MKIKTKVMSVRGIKAGVAGLLAVLAFLGCKGSQPNGTVNASTGSASGSSSTDGSVVPASYASGDNRVEYISDPTLQMNAIGVTIPANWQFQSVFLQGGTCAPTPFGVFRATSPDGSSMVERMPTLAWAWGQGPMIGYMPKTDCLPMKGPLSAQEFLKYLASTMKLSYDGDLAVPSAEQAKADKQLSDAQSSYASKFAASGLQMPKEQEQLARAAVSYTKNSVPMKGVLDVTVLCLETRYPGQPGMSAYAAGQPSIVDKCTASTTYYTAPANQLDALMRIWDTPGMGPKPEDAWVQAYVNRSNQQTAENITEINRQGAERRQMLAQQFQHSMAVQQQMHDQFMQGMQDQYNHFQAGIAANQFARDTSVSDWVDFALDRQTVMDTNTGRIYKTTNQVTVGGSLEQVHGNGTPW